MPGRSVDPPLDELRSGGDFPGVAEGLEGKAIAHLMPIIHSTDPDRRILKMELFEDDDYYTGPRLDGEMIWRAEEELGVRLPCSYIEMLRLRNGGTPQRRCFPTTFPTSWADDHFEISGIRGIGGSWGIDSSSERVVHT